MFNQITAELYGARKNGYKFDPNAELILNQEIFPALIAERGNGWVDAKIDSFFDDYGGDLFEDENSIPYAVDFTYEDGEYVPMWWHRLVRCEQ